MIFPSLKNIPHPVYQVPETDFTYFPGLQEQVPQVEWCVDNEFCCTLDDYLRRRTNISQWTPRQGLGFNDENLEYLRENSACLPVNGDKNHEFYLHEYRNSVQRKFDTLVGGVNLSR